ncbi:MAG TPA: hypothetical protein VK586_15785 [Streptosporangiaceae bacterium]|nr:hypothetical protein [Streptosporangiaceae bacterium]
MTAAEDWDEDDDQEPDDDWYDDDDLPEPDPEDGDIARAYEEHFEHLDAVHGGGECDCRPSLAERLARRARDIANWLHGIRCRLTVATRRPCTLRLGPAEITVRLRADRGCDACSGRGWFYTMTPKPEFPVPAGYNGAALCGCGSAIGKLAETRRYLRRTDREPPF